MWPRGARSSSALSVGSPALLYKTWAAFDLRRILYPAPFCTVPCYKGMASRAGAGRQPVPVPKPAR